MRRVLARALCFALFMSVTGPATGSAEIEISASLGSRGSDVSVSYFYDNLSSDGEWFQDPSHGWCWTPYDMSEDWRPYYDGHWEYTNYGWSWASNERWGWATYHYGRWAFDDSYGWIWIPGNEWAPAWVAWRYGDNWVGWAPLPPTARWDVAIGLSFNDANSIRSNDWCFVPERNMVDVNLRVQVTSVARNVTLIGRTRDATRFEVRDGRPANIGIDVALVETSVKRRVPRTTVVDVDTPERGRGQRTGQNVEFYRPRVRAEAPDKVPAPAVASGRGAIPADVVQRQRDVRQRKLDTNLKAERVRLARDQKSDLRAQPAGPAADEIRKRHVAELQALDVHEAQQRKVLDQRMQKRIVRADKAKSTAKPTTTQGKGQAKEQTPQKGESQDKSQDKGQTQDKTQDKGNGKAG